MKNCASGDARGRTSLLESSSVSRFRPPPSGSLIQMSTDFPEATLVYRKRPSRSTEIPLCPSRVLKPDTRAAGAKLLLFSGTRHRVEFVFVCTAQTAFALDATVRSLYSLRSFVKRSARLLCSEIFQRPPSF